MPPRLNKRQQRELEELEALGGPSKPHDSSSEEESRPPARAQANAGFAALFTPGEDEQDSADDSPTAPKTRKIYASAEEEEERGDPATVPRAQTPVISESPRPVLKNEKKAAKKAKARERKAGKDEFDQALAELSIKYPELQNVANSSSAAASSSSSASTLASLLSQHKTGAAASRRQTAQRSNLTRPPATWFQTLPREGLSLRPLSDEELVAKQALHAWDRTRDEKWWTVEYSKKYKSVTLAFMTIVYSGDPNGFYGLLQKFPWHGIRFSNWRRSSDTEEYAQAVEYVDRALFAYERAFFGSYNLPPNRPFFLAGLCSYAFEFARLLLSLDPSNDPHGALLHLDFLAVKTGMEQWLLDMFDLYATRRSGPRTKDSRADPSLLPGWSYARALALRATGKAKDPAAEAALHLLSHLYAQRSFPLWKEESSWFASTVTTEFSSLPASLPVPFRRLFSYIPKEVLAVKALQCDPLPPPTAGTEDLRTFMPAATTRQRAQQGRILAQLIPDADVREQLQPHVVRHFFNAMPAVQERFPEGVLQFAEAAAQMDPEEFEVLMLAAIAANEDALNVNPGGMPGEMPGFPPWEEGVAPAAPEPVPAPVPEEEAIGEDEEDSDSTMSTELNISQPLPIRVLRNVIRRFWGGNGNVDDSSSDEEERAIPVDTAGVD
ncbi:transcriptional repressor TCF25-domain-containing protein [Mycena alexandri]|uniref:Transcriptional repressor TCF25-domain-containing protein n=1 Tax=Mycena alexandri TaxID=1745969 RepID=A0AAD6WZ35_9AGAR|nr:transcriptional repressor TCF25-domain-containing protein [Mycena alexandri]